METNKNMKNNHTKKLRLGCADWMKFRPETELAITLKRSKKTNLAFSNERCFGLCLESFRIDHKTGMARKKKAAASFLPETSPSTAIVFQIIEDCLPDH